MRQERSGLVMGTYERNCVPWSPKQTPWDFGHELLPPDFDRISGNLAMAFDHFPALETAGIKQVINGPFTFAPDGNPWSARCAASATSGSPAASWPASARAAASASRWPTGRSRAIRA